MRISAIIPTDTLFKFFAIIGLIGFALVEAGFWYADYWNYRFEQYNKANIRNGDPDSLKLREVKYCIDVISRDEPELCDSNTKIGRVPNLKDDATYQLLILQDRKSALEKQISEKNAEKHRIESALSYSRFVQDDESKKTKFIWVGGIMAGLLVFGFIRWARKSWQDDRLNLLELEQRTLNIEQSRLDERISRKELLLIKANLKKTILEIEKLKRDLSEPIKKSRLPFN